MTFNPARLHSSLQVFACILGLTACASAPQGSLYERLGGQATVAGVVNRTLERSSTDPRTRRSFDGVKLSVVQASLAQQICAITGGGCTYEGETMARSHQDLKIRPSEFDALVDILRGELDRTQVQVGAKNELLKLLAPMKRDIVAGH